MKISDEFWQTIKDMQKKLFKKNDPGIPKRWNCCDMMVPPRDLAWHIKEYHMEGYKWTDSDRIEFISIIWGIGNFFAMLILQGR